MHICIYGDSGKSSIMKHLMGYTYDHDIFTFNNVIFGIQYSDIYAIQFRLLDNSCYCKYNIGAHFIETFGDDFITLSTYRRDIDLLLEECYRLLSSVNSITEVILYSPFKPDVKVKLGSNLIFEIPSNLSADTTSLYLGSADKIILTRNVLEDYSSFDEIYIYRYRNKTTLALTKTDCVSFVNVESLVMNKFLLKLPRISFRSLQYSFREGLIYEGRKVTSETLKSFKRIFK